MNANTVIRKIVTKISIGGTSLLGRSLPSNMEAINITSHLAIYCIKVYSTETRLRLRHDKNRHVSGWIRAYIHFTQQSYDGRIVML